MPDTKRPFVAQPNRGLNHASVAGLLVHRASDTPHAPALRHWEGGVWRSLSFRQWADASAEMAVGLRRAIDLKPGESVAIMSNSRVEWAMLDAALAMAGGVSVPIYPSLSADDTTYILEDSGAVALVVEHPEHLRRVFSEPQFADRLKALRAVIYLDESVDLPAKQGGGRVELADVTSGERPCRALAAIRREGADASRTQRVDLDACARDVGLEDPYTIIYTSGTTGQPKGVELSHRNMVYETWAIRNSIAVTRDDEQLMVLPLAHIFARHTLWAAVEMGCATAFARGIDTLAEDLRDLAPTWLAAVPRIYEKVHAKVLSQAAEGSAVQKRAFQWAMDVGRAVSESRQQGLPVPLKLRAQALAADRLVFSKLRDVFGGRIRFFISGGAPLSREIAEFFHAAGMLILEGWGLSETTGAATVNRPDRFRFGTVGPALPGVELRLDEDGEILVRGLSVMRGYRGRPEDTAAVLDEAGWFRTGDIGELTDGFLRITDRKKNLIKTAGGKYIAPQRLENALALAEGISQVLVHGEGRPYAVALVSIDAAAMTARLAREGIELEGADLAQDPRVIETVEADVAAVNDGLASFETIKQVGILPRELTEEDGEVTPTLKIRRKIVEGRYKALLEELYARPKPTT